MLLCLCGLAFWRIRWTRGCRAAEIARSRIRSFKTSLSWSFVFESRVHCHCFQVDYCILTKLKRSNHDITPSLFVYFPLLTIQTHWFGHTLPPSFGWPRSFLGIPSQVPTKMPIFCGIFFVCLWARCICFWVHFRCVRWTPWLFMTIFCCPCCHRWNEKASNLHWPSMVLSLA